LGNTFAFSQKQAKDELENKSELAKQYLLIKIILKDTFPAFPTLTINISIMQLE
jgi:hypothetical protein